jgi:hypothetical protein
MTALLAAAQSYAQRGWPVFPLVWWDGDACSCGDPACPSPGKHPYFVLAPRGFYNATTDADTISQWWAREPRCNIGIRTGAESGLLVIDVDTRATKDGEQTLREITRVVGPLPDTVEAITGSKSRHLLFQYPGHKVAAKLGEGIDVKSDGGYIVGAPSNHMSGFDYVWNADQHPDDVPVAALPAAWLTRLQRSESVALVPATAGEVFSPYLIKKIRSATGVLSPDDYDTYVGVGMALHHESRGHDMAFGLWWEWCSSWVAVNPQTKKASLTEVRRHWSGFGKTTGDPRTFGWLWRSAEAQGWIAPEAPVPVVRPSAPLATFDARWATDAPGMLGTVVRWSLATAPVPVPVYSLAAALALGSVASGRQYQMRGTFSPLFLLVSGRTASGKDHVNSTIKAVLRAVDRSLLGPGEFASESAVLSTLAHQPQIVSVMDEFGQQLSGAKAQGMAHKAGALRQMMVSWSSASSSMEGKALSSLGMKPSDVRPPVSIERPCLVLVGLTTPVRLHKGLESDHIGDGFLNRWLLLEHDEPRETADAKTLPPVPEGITEWMRRVAAPRGDLPRTAGTAPAALEVPVDDDALALLRTLAHDATARDNALDAALQGLWGRAGEQVARVALIAALADAETPVLARVSVAHVQWAHRVVWWSVHRLVAMAQDRLGDSPFELMRSKALAAVQASGTTGLSRRELMRGAMRSQPAHNVDAVMLALQEAGQVRVGTSGAKNRAHYWAGDDEEGE